MNSSTSQHEGYRKTNTLNSKAYLERKKKKESSRFSTKVGFMYLKPQVIK